MEERKLIYDTIEEFDTDLMELADSLESIDTEYELEDARKVEEQRLRDQVQVYGAILTM